MNGDKIYADAEALCYGVASEVIGVGRMVDFTVRERAIVERLAEWMGSRDCSIVRLREIADQLVIEATMATNALGCVARAQYQHAEVARLHIAIRLLKDQLTGQQSSSPADPLAASGGER